MRSYLARTDDVLVEDLDDGVVVYDTRSHEAHWLDAGSAAVWRACADARTLADIATLACQDLGFCEAALDRLTEIGLVRTEALDGITRRSALRTAAKVGAAGVAAAPIVSAIIPVAAAHASSGGSVGGGGGGGQTHSYTVQSGYANAQDGSPDPNNQVSDDGTAYVQATITSNGAYAVLPGTAYIASANQGNVQTFYFRTTGPIVIPAGASNAQISGQFYADNHAQAFVNGTLAGSVDGFNGTPGTFTAPLNVGNNALTFNLVNDGGPSGLDYFATVSYTL